VRINEADIIFGSMWVRYLVLDELVLFFFDNHFDSMLGLGVNLFCQRIAESFASLN
jgi:hypothetical protein